MTFKVRKYQQPFFSALTGLGRDGSRVEQKDRLIEIAHRRWGKDEVALRATLLASHQRPASYWHCLPIYEQGRKALWTAVNPSTGKRRIEEAFPPEVIETRDEQSMFIRFKWGSTWQIVGSDRYDSLVGAGVAGVVFSEWALANPSAWGYIRPMVEENGGWAAFITTPRGENHAKDMFDMAMRSDRWFAEVSNVYDTKALTEDQLEEALEEYQALYGIDFGRAMFEQEYLCSFSGAMVGAFFGAEMNRADKQGRIRPVEIDWDHPVNTTWDLGKNVNNPIWCWQRIDGELRVVDFYTPESEDLDDWCGWLDDRGYKGYDYVPHDILTPEWGTPRTRLSRLASKRGEFKVKRLPIASIGDGLQAGRTAINEAVFHRGEDERGERMKRGLNGLRNYRREWDDDKKTFKENALKDWSEHIGSAWRYVGLAQRDYVAYEPKPEKPKELQYEVVDGRIQGNMSVRDFVEMRERRRRD